MKKFMVISRGAAFLAAFMTLFLGSAGLSAGQSEGRPDYDRILTILFPETASWIPVKTLPRLTSEEVKKLQPELSQAFLGSKLNDSEKRMDFIRGLFFDLKSTTLYRFDVDVDGREDIMYVGECFGASWYTTIIWFNGEKGYVIKQKQWWTDEMLRISPGKLALVGSVGPGCCGEMDEYYKGDFDQPEGKPSFYSGLTEPVKVFQRTAIPSSILKPMKFMAPDQELVLRYSPEINDKYEPGISKYLCCAVFGNILAKYIPGCSGTILGEERDKDGGRWYFVHLDEKCIPLRWHFPYEVNAGWIKASPGIIIQ